MKSLKKDIFPHTNHIGSGRLQDCLKGDYWRLEDDSGRSYMNLDIDANKLSVNVRDEDGTEVFRMVWDAGFGKSANEGFDEFAVYAGQDEVARIQSINPYNGWSLKMESVDPSRKYSTKQVRLGGRPEHEIYDSQEKLVGAFQELNFLKQRYDIALADSELLGTAVIFCMANLLQHFLNSKRSIMP